LKPPGKIILYIAIGLLLAFMGGMVYVSLLDIPELEKSELRFGSVELVSVDSIKDKVKLKVVFLLKNNAEKTITVPVVSYELFANAKSMGSSSYTAEDIPMTGRIPFFPGKELPLDSYIVIPLSDDNRDVYSAIVNGEDVTYSVTGQYTVETAWQLIEVEFEKSL
jgi:hypothetical protein|tara:strand:- start:1007 stop:1501 length:495 start_codon:yes stop_codon:yes gene_type:complete